MTSQATNRREGGLTSCHSHSRQFCSFTYKELDTVVRVAQKLTTGRGVPGQGVVVDGIK
jgi:hypothetical protein